MALSTGVKVAIGIAVAVILVIIVAILAFVIYKIFESRKNNSVPVIGSGAVSVAAGAATPHDVCTVNGTQIQSAFVRYSLVATSKDGKTARIDESPLSIPIGSLTRVITIDVSKLSNTISVALLRTVLQSNNFVSNQGGNVLTQTSNLGQNIVYTDSQIWPICAESNAAAT